ncbi:MAG: two-component system, OmpR family, operon response regulator KdpE [Chloroflexia bacterium]|jgi:DNA-binding response OmpR family regulator|nr:two-component system, OmpR family, operon response regulator KdpE [Chloroflexia bacterium]
MKFLVVDDDKAIVEAVTIGLQFQWQDAEVHGAPDGERGLRMFFDVTPDVTLLDVNMPGMSGFELLQRIREVSDAPVLMLTARGDEMSKVKGLELGADDYLTKPFSHLELFARIKAILRRSELPAPVSSAPSFVSGEVALNFDSRELSVKGQPVKLTPTEYKLLYQLVRNAGRVLPFDMLLSKVWGDEYRGDMDYLKTYISRLRKKLGDDSENPHYILTERSVGYRFARMNS